MNVKLLRRIERHILAEPKRFWMHWFVTKKNKGTPNVYMGNGLYRPFPKCGTAGCIAGWACMLSKMKVDPNMHLIAEARKLLVLDANQAARLFLPSQWPERFRAGVADDGKAKTVKVAVERIEHFISTEGRE